MQAGAAQSNSDRTERSLGIEGSPNFRDAGGYACDGGRLHWGKLFRSGHLASLGEADQARLASLGLELVLDLRRADERESEPSCLPPAVEVYDANITPGSQASAIYSDSTQLGGAEAMYRFMCDINAEFVRSQTDIYRGVFGAVLASDAQRVLFHCSAGKDRTGFAVAMLHLALGVSADDIEADYLLSGRYYLPEQHMPRLRRKYAVDHLSDADLLPMMTTDFAYLHAALDAIDADWDSRDLYLSDGLGLGEHERRELRRRFVDSA